MKKYTIILIALMALVSCAKEQNPAGVANEIRFNIGLPVTKATATAFENGDMVSLYAVEYNDDTQVPLQVGGNYFNNEKLTFNGTAWAGTKTLYWSDKACDFYAFYPYQETIGSIEACPFQIATDQNGEGYETSDLLYATATKVSRSAGTVDLAFHHMMSKLIVKLEKGLKFEGEIPDDVVAHIYNTTTSCIVDWSKGAVEKDAFGNKNTITMKKLSNSKFEAVLVPQNIEKRTPLIELTMGGIAYLLEYSLSFRPGYVHTVTVTLNTSPDQEQIEINIDPNVEDWN